MGPFLSPAGRSVVLASVLLSTGPVYADAPDVSEVSFETTDGAQIHGVLSLPATAPSAAVVWVHELGHSRSDWDYISGRLIEQGVASLAIDLRGHGQSTTGASGSFDRDLFEVADYHSMQADVAAAADYLCTQLAQDPCSLHMVGAAYGSSLVLNHAVGDPRIQDLVLLSPGLYYEELNVAGKAAAYGDRRMLIVYSREDGYSLRSAERMESEAVGPKLVRAYYGAGHGALMMGRESDLEPLLQGWLLGSINPQAPSLPPGAEARLDGDGKEAISDDLEALEAAEAQRRESRERSADGARSRERGEQGTDPDVETRRWDDGSEEEAAP